jgi:hypothetical protein
LQESYDWYEDQSSELGERFMREVDDYLEIVGKNPHHFAVKSSGKYRFAPLIPTVIPNLFRDPITQVTN